MLDDSREESSVDDVSITRRNTDTVTSGMIGGLIGSLTGGVPDS